MKADASRRLAERGPVVLSKQEQATQAKWREQIGAAKYTMAIRLLQVSDRWKELRRARSDNEQIRAIDLLTQKQHSDIVATLLLISCTFPEHFTYLTGEEPGTYRPKSGDRFSTGEMHEWTSLSRLWGEDTYLQEAVAELHSKHSWNMLKEYLLETENELKLKA